MPLFEDALSIYQRVSGDKHVGTVGLVEELAAARQAVVDARHTAPPVQRKNDDLIDLLQAAFREEQEARGRLHLALEQVHARFCDDDAQLQTALERECAQRALSEQQLRTELSSQRDELLYAVQRTIGKDGRAQWNYLQSETSCLRSGPSLNHRASGFSLSCQRLRGWWR